MLPSCNQDKFRVDRFFKKKRTKYEIFSSDNVFYRLFQPDSTLKNQKVFFERESPAIIMAFPFT